jgi:hypothetical protein
MGVYVKVSTTKTTEHGNLLEGGKPQTHNLSPETHYDMIPKQQDERYVLCITLSNQRSSCGVRYELTNMCSLGVRDETNGRAPKTSWIGSIHNRH